MNTYDSLEDLIGRTPLLRLHGLSDDREVYAKCEFLNPYSVKDRPVLQIIRDAEQAGQLRKGSTVIEATSGNTGIALASIAARRGYRCVLVMSEAQSLERRQVLQALGATVVLTPASDGTRGAKARVLEIVQKNPDYFYIGQHQNPSNPRAHYLQTGPELWDDTDGGIDILVAGLGTGGTLTGAGRYLKEKKPSVQVIGIEPREAPFISQGKFRPHRIMGTAPGFVPETLDREVLDEVFLVGESQAFEACRLIAKKEGLLVGISSGACAHAALEVARRPDNREKVVVCVFADTGERYLSVDDLFSEPGSDAL
jgi:cysteine synthase A